MKMLTKDTDYAVRALIYLAKSRKEYVSSKEISEKGNIPLHFLRKVIQKMIHAGLIESKEGINGGSKLAKDPKKVYVTSMIRIFQGDIQLLDCMFRGEKCTNRKTCILRKKMLKIEKMVIKELEGITIDSLIDG